MTNPYVEEAENLAKLHGYSVPLADQPEQFLQSVFSAMPADESLALSMMKAYQGPNGDWHEIPEQLWFTMSDGFRTALVTARDRNRKMILFHEGLKEPNSVFWNCASRKAKIATSKSKRGNVGELLHITSLWCDVDCALNDYSLTDVEPALLEIPLPPTWIVFSGGGLQCVWVLTEAVDVSTIALALKHKNLMVTFTQPIFDRLNIVADLSVAESVRMLRLPASVNRKYERESAIAQVVFHDPAHVYTHSTIQEYVRQRESKSGRKLQPPKPSQQTKNAETLNYACLDKGAETLIGKWLDKVEAATEGHRHDTLVNALRAVLPLVAANRAEYATVETLFKSTARNIGLEHEEVEEIFKWAWKQAETSPLYSKGHQEIVERIDLHAEPLDLDSGNAIPRVYAGMSVPLLDRQYVIEAAQRGGRGMGELLYLMLRGRVRYDCAEDCFYYWSGHSYTKDRTRLIRHSVLYIQAQLEHYADELRDEAELAEAGAKREAAKTNEERNIPQEELLREQASEKNQHAKAMTRLSKRLNEPYGVSNTMDMLKDNQAVSISGDEWDRLPYLLAVRNGVIDLKTGTLRNGRPDDLLRTTCPTTWEGLEAHCPQFEKFLAEIFEGTPELIAFTQRLFGYGLIGEVIHHILVIMTGKGRNGKDTLLETLYSVFGEFIGPVSNDVFIRQSDGTAGRPTPHLMSLRGKRIVWASETQEGAYLNGAQVKLITGGGTLRARPLHGNEVNITVSHLPILLTNFLPRLVGVDYALTKRIHLIPFNQTFVANPELPTEHKADPHLLGKLRSEAPGILAWLVRGCLEYQREGLNPPEIVLMATKQYMEAENVIVQFVSDCCEVAEEHYAAAGELWNAYKAWCDEQGIRTGTQKTFKERMISKGFDHLRGERGAHYYRGLALLTDDDQRGSASQIATSV